MKRKILILMLLAFSQLCWSQQEPATNIGLTYMQMKQKFPNLRFLERTAEGDNYQDGYTEDGISYFFTFRSNRLVQECVIVESNNGFAQSWFDEVKTAFVSRAANSTVYVNEAHSLYSTFTVHMYYSRNYNKESATVIYMEGGYKNGVPISEFNRRWGLKTR